MTIESAGRCMDCGKSTRKATSKRCTPCSARHASRVKSERVSPEERERLRTEAKERRKAKDRAYYQSSPKRRDYMREYQRNRRSDEYWKDPCPICGKSKVRTSKLCLACSRLATRTRKQRPAAVNPSCPYCSGEMRSIDWNYRQFFHCTGCGLETTPEEIERFHWEEAA